MASMGLDADAALRGQGEGPPCAIQGGDLAGLDFRQILDAMAEAVVAADETHRVVYANAAAEALLGWPAGELADRPLTDLIPVRLRAAHREGFKRFLATRRPRLVGRSVRVPALHRDGREIEVELGLAALRCGAGDLIVATLRDLSGSVELERQLAVTRYLRATTKAAAVLGAHREPESLLEQVVATLVADFDAVMARAWLHEPLSRSLVLKASAGPALAGAARAPERLDLAVDPSKIGQVARARAPRVVHEVAEDPDFDRAWAARERIAAAAVLPLTLGGELLGVLALYTRRPVPEEVVEALTAFAAVVAATLRDVQLLAREQAARREAEAQRRTLQTVLDTIPVGVLVADSARGRLTLANPAAEAIAGEPIPLGTIEQFVEQFPLQRLDGRRFRPEDRPLGRTLDEREPMRERLVYRRRDGREVVLDVATSPFPGPDGGAVTTFSDMTEELRLKQELEERVAQFRALLDHLPVGVAYFDDQGICRAANDAAARLLGHRRREFAGMAADTLFAGAESAADLAEAVRRCAAQQAPHAESAVVWRDAAGLEKRRLDWQFEPLPPVADRQPGVLALIIDASDRVRAEAALRGAAEDAELASRNKTRFLSAVSHDLRTPVNALGLQAELLARLVDDKEPVDEDLAHLAGDLRQAAGNLIELINDLLDLTRFDSGQVEHHPTDFPLEDWLASTLGPLSVEARRKGLGFGWRAEAPGLIVRADRVKLGRVLVNLAGNAVKFTDAGAVEVRAGATAEGWLALSVRDTGPGIPADQIGRIFDEFAQLRNPERDRSKGTGLGLAICRRLVETVGGRLEVQSTPGVGSTFTALLPPDHLPAGAVPDPSSLEVPTLAPPAPAPILLVEDDARSRRALTRLLEHAGHAVIEAADGAETLRVLGETRPALVLLDLMLPGLSGLEVLRRIRASPSGSNVPVIILSGDLVDPLAADLAELGVAGVMAKPVDFDELLNVVARHALADPARPAATEGL